MPADNRKPAVATFPLVGPGMSEVAALVATVRRLAIARSVPEVMHTTTQAARNLLLADGIICASRRGLLLLRRGGCYIAALEGAALSDECLHFRLVYARSKACGDTGHLQR